MKPLNITTEILELKEARDRLEEIKPRVARLMELSGEIRRLHPKLSALDPDSPTALGLSAELAGLHDEWRENLKAINELGGYVKDPTVGLLDFYSWLDGELVFLCWQHGEETIVFWHGLHEGRSGRKRVPAREDD